MGAPNPKARSVSNIKAKLLQPALTSTFECYFAIPNTFPSISQDTVSSFISKSVPVTTDLSDLLTLSCSDATLPGSQLATHELNNDFTGVTQRHAYRRLYDDRADFTFYVNNTYTQIRLFERWMQFISGEQNATSANLNSFYRIMYPRTYKTTIYITKFEKDIAVPGKAPLEPSSQGRSKLIYSFFNAFPISITSMPVSYEASQLLKCTVSFSYDRYVTENKRGTDAAGTAPPSASGVPDPINISPEQQAVLNSNSIFNTGQTLNFGVEPIEVSNNLSPNQFNISPGTLSNTGAGTIAESSRITRQLADAQNIA